MNNPPGAPQTQFTDAVVPRLIQDVRFHFNLQQDVITITGGKLELCLRKHIECLAAKGQWLTPGTLFISFVATFAASSFHDAFGLTSAVWEAIFILLTAGSVIWFAVSCVRAWKLKTSLELLIKEIKKASDGLGNQEQPPSTQPRVTLIQNPP